jgi:AcrR family transcriptional regulator
LNNSDDVKPRRAYRSGRRREQARETRARVLAAAARLFAERGYESATIAGIAEAAAVSPETIYATFRNKRTLLAELVSSAVRGDDDAPVLEQAGPRAVAAARDQREQLRLFAADIAVRLERVGPLLEVLTTAARSDPELAELRAKIHGERLSNLGSFVEALTANGPLRVEPEAALDDVWALASPELHQLLTRTRGWTRDRYCSWLADSLAALLLER